MKLQKIPEKSNLFYVALVVLRSVPRDLITSEWVWYGFDVFTVSCWLLIVEAVFILDPGVHCVIFVLFVIIVNVSKVIQRYIEMNRQLITRMLNGDYMIIFRKSKTSILNYSFEFLSF